MHRLIILLLVISTLTACAPRLDPPTSNTSQLTPITDNTNPRPGDETLLRGTVYIDSVDLLVMESFPLQFSLILNGSLPTPCHQLRVLVNPPDEESRIFVDVYSLVDADNMCIEVLQPFSKNIPLGSFPGGHFTIWVNGDLVSEFDA